MFDIFTLTSYPGATKVKNKEEAIALSRTRFCWILDEHNSYAYFDFLWEPSPWESEQVHVWPSRFQDNGGTMLLPKNPGPDTNYLHEIIPRNEAFDMIFMDHGNVDADTRLSSLCDDFSVSEITKTRVIGDYLSTFKRIIRNCTQDYVWIVSSLCNYTSFDFQWHPSEWDNTLLHVWPSNEQKFGDTFLINVQSFKDQMDNLESLEDYDAIKFRKKIVSRNVLPIYLHLYDNQVDAIKSTLFKKIDNPNDFNDPLTLFSNGIDFELKDIPTISLWSKESRAITPLNKGASTVIVPKEALSEVKTQLYDYPYINKSYKDTLSEHLLDIVFLDYSEKVAHEHYEHLKKHTINTVHRVSNQTGRLKAYNVCAGKSTTDWFFVVYAKLKVDKNFDWSWQPDRMQQQKHYIFNAYNAITGDTYGHMGMIAFNKNLILEHTGKGLDFALAQPHEVVPILSGEAIYATEPWAAWRTAFREVLKLYANGHDLDSVARRLTWQGATDEWTKKGVIDAERFYNEVNGDPEKLYLSYEWDWLFRYFYMKYCA